jgi:hypothetical protein
MNRHIYTTEILADGEPVEATITFTVHPGYAGSRIDPPEEPTPEILSITIDGKAPSDLLAEEIRAQVSEADLMAEAHEQARDYAEEASDYRNEMMREDRL